MKSIFNPYKLLNHFDHLSSMVKDNKTFPLAAEIDLTNKCNHRCIWCMFEKFKRREPLALDKKLAFSLLQEFKEIGVKGITFVGGGEPLFHRDFDEILECAYHYGFDIGLVTNGELLHKKIDIVKRFCKFVRISLDAGSKKTHDKLHRPYSNQYKTIKGWSSYARIIKSLRWLCNNKKDLVVGVAYLVHPDNFFELPGLTDLLVLIKADYLQIRPVYMKNLSFSKKMLEEVNENIDLCMEKAKDTSLHVIPLKRRFDQIIGEDLIPKKCLAHSVLAIVCANAKVYLCCQLRGHNFFELGDLNKSSFREIWKGEQRQEAINRIDIERCPPCRYRTYNKIMDYMDSERRHCNFL